jgi:hypothetical protein
VWFNVGGASIRDELARLMTPDQIATAQTSQATCPSASVSAWPHRCFLRAPGAPFRPPRRPLERAPLGSFFLRPGPRRSGREWLALGAYQSGAQLVQPGPCRPVGAETQRCRSIAEMPVRRVLISNTARNHTLSGLCVLSSSVPDVRLVWWPHSAHSNRMPSRSVHTRVLL